MCIFAYSMAKKLSLVLLLLCSCSQLWAQEEHLLLGKPAKAGTTAADSLQYLLLKKEYALSYNMHTGTANWVSWQLDSTWLGGAERQDNFRVDSTLPEGWPRVRPSNYSNTGFDKGHLCPSADRTKDVASNSATFLMTNMLPQSPKNNRQTWANLEEYSRKLVEEGFELYIVAGPYGMGGEGVKGFSNFIFQERIQVPEYVWKVILVLPKGEDDLQRISSTTRVIAVKMPNVQSIVSDWTTYRVSVDELEKLTGFDFLNALPIPIQKELEKRVDDVTVH